MRGGSHLLVVLLLLAVPVMADTDPLGTAEAPAAVRRAVFRAETAYRRGEVAAAVQVLDESLADGDDRDHPALRYRLGSYLLELGRAAEAVPHLKRASEQAPASPPVWADLARATYETGDHATAARAFASAHESMQSAYAERPQDNQPADPTLLYYSAVAWILADREATAVDILVPLVQSARDTVPRGWVQALVSAAAASEQPARADRAVRRLLRDHANVPDVWILASQQAQLRDDAAVAAQRLQVADWLRPLAARDIRHLADLYGAARLPRLAARTYARLWPGDQKVARQLAVSWLQAHEPDSARVVLNAAVADNADPGFWTLLGDLEYEVERWDDARRAYKKATDLDAGAGRAWLMQGACGLKLDDYAAARAALRSATSIAAVAGEARRLLRHIDAISVVP